MKIAIMLLAMCLLGMAPATGRQADAQERIIDVIYDNSGSMAFNDTDRLDSADNYITRWVEADYAVRALAALTEDGDRLYLFPMDKNKEAAEPQENIHYYEISSPDDADIDKASENFGNTWYAGVENAIRHLKSRTGERWIIILTDSENKDIWERTLNEVLREADGIGVLYVPITEDSERLSLDAGTAGKVTQIEPDGSAGSLRGNIFSQILGATDYIYRRNSLTLSHSPQGLAEFRIDAPVRELIVLMQAEGNTVYFKDRQPTPAEALYKRAEALGQELGAETGLTIRRSESFQSYSSETEPSYSGNQSFSDNLQIKDIQGEMIAFGGKSTVHEGSIYEKAIPVKSNESVNIYYQLDLGIELELSQGGELVDGEDIFEGEYEARVWPVNPHSGERVARDAQLLDGLRVSINGGSVRFGETVHLNAVYPEQENLDVRVEGAALEEELSLTKSLEVKERIYPLAVQVLNQPDFFDYDRMNLEDIESGEADAIHIRLSENADSGRIGLRDSTIANLELSCIVHYRGLKNQGEPRIAVRAVRVEGSGDEYLLYPYLADKEDYEIYRDVTVRIAAWRKDGEEQSRCEQELGMTLKAGEAVLEAELYEGRRYSGAELTGGDVSYSLTCNGEEIPEAELGKLSFRTLKGGCRYVNLSQTDSAMQFFRKLWYSIYWLYNNKETVNINSEITYMRRGVPCTALLHGEISVILLPLPLRLLLYTFTAGICLLLLYMLFNLLTGRCLPPFFFCTVYFNNDPELGIRMRPGRWQSLCQLVHPAGGMSFGLSEEQGEMYGIECPNLLICKGKRGKYYLKNWQTYARQDNYRINGQHIFRGNARMTKEDRFEFKDSAGLWNTIMFRGGFMTGEDGKR